MYNFISRKRFPRIKYISYKIIKIKIMLLTTLIETCINKHKNYDK